MIQNSKIKIQNSAGFTIIELLVTLALTAVAVTAGLLVLGGYNASKNLKSEGDQMTAALQNARQNSISQQNSARWGVHFSNTTSTQSYSLFYGSSYASGTIAGTYALRGSIQFGNPSVAGSIDTLFNVISGYLTSPQVISLHDGRSDGQVYDITVNTLGKITVVSDEGLVGYWHFDESTSTTAYDASGKGNNGTLVSGPARQSGSNCKAGGCLSFDGTDDYVDVGTSVLNKVSEGSVSIWVKLSASGAANGGEPWYNTTLLSNDNIYMGLQVLSSNRIRYYYYDGSPRYYDSAAALSLNRWYLLTATWNALGSVLYIDGAQDASSTLTWANVHPSHTDQSNYIGKYGGGYFMNGLVDEVRVWTRALPATEILDQYNALQ